MYFNFWGTTRVHSRAFVVQHFSVRDFFFIMKETDPLSYADENTPYRTADTIDEVIKLPKRDSMMLFKRFPDNQIKETINKFHLLVNKMNEVIIWRDGI